MQKFLESIKKRNGKIVPFSEKKIEEAISKALAVVGDESLLLAKKVAEKVLHSLKKKFGFNIPTVEQVQDIVEAELISEGLADCAKAYILYRNKRSEFRESQAFIRKIDGLVQGYVSQSDWRVAENSNASYSLSGLQAHISGAVIAEYTLKYIYPAEIGQAHRNGDFHIHDLGLGTFAGYCAGWSLRQLLEIGFNGVHGRVSASPAKHFNSALGQIVNFLGTMQNEWAGAQAFSSFDTYLAPLAAKDGLNYKEIKQAIQEFVFAINATSRWGNQVPFTNITLDWTVPEDMKDQPVLYGGQYLQDETYSNFQEQMDMINKAFIEVMIKGDINGRIFTFPIPTYNITTDFNWDSENANLLFEMTAKYGIPYFQNFINSSLKPSDVRSMCCRLQLDMRELKSKTGGLFGSGEKTGSIGVVTVNLPRLGFLSKTEEEFFDRAETLLYLAKESLEIKRKEVNKNMEEGLLPWSKRYLGTLKFHFSTIGIVGMHECCLNFLGKGVDTPAGKAFAHKVMDFFRAKIMGFQVETGHIFNLEATPAEGTAYRLARIDKRTHPEIITSGTPDIPYYTNSSQLPVGYTDDIFEALEHQDELQTKYTGGTVLHGFIGERIDSPEACKKLVKKIAYKFRLPYFTITPTFSVCPVHGYIRGEHFCCPHLNEEGVKQDERPREKVLVAN
ncbi:ribonucleoside triphosphate reductase [Candidatus Saganbacteria bacterium]|nr:ribonucleoside triphosphate reductase [Candidatus Saganbacteria bacterium]